MIKNLKKYVAEVEDFPKKGISFKDISPILYNPSILKQVIKEFAKHSKDIDVIVAPDARGFLLATPLALKVKKPVVMVRKPNKLPGKLISIDYTLEYGQNTLEMIKGYIKEGQRVLIVDDLLATGGTTKAVVDLIKKQKAVVSKALFIIELPELKGRDILKNIEVISLISY